MDENLNPDFEGQTPVVEGQTTTASEVKDVATGESVSAVPAEQQTTEPTTAEPPKAEKKTQSPEENAAFKALRLEERQRAESAAKDAFAVKTAKDIGLVNFDGSPIKSAAEYETALASRLKYNELLNNGVPDSEATLQVELEQLRREKAEMTQKAQREQQTAQERTDFFEYFKALNGRDWSPDSDPIPQEVWEANANGVPLKYAYADHFAKQQIQRNKAVETGKKTAEANATNAATAAGSIASGGSAENGEITQADIDAHANDRAWVRKNLTKIHKFYGLKG